MIEKTCEICGATYLVKPYRSLKARFCGKACAGKWHASVILNARPHTWLIGNQHRKGKHPTRHFERGHTPWNKDMANFRPSPATEFKPGQVAINHQPVGTVRIRYRRRCPEQPRAFVKIAEPNVWQLRAIAVWEKKHGPLQRGYVVHHKDRDSLNDSPENLEAMTRAQHIDEHRREFRRRDSA